FFRIRQGILRGRILSSKRSLIEDVFKVIKGAFSLDKIHRFTLSSVKKIASLGVVLISIAISLGFRDKGSLQRLAEW
ncbi:MAG: IS5-like element ISArch21 family transposase, partial [Candidatus Syntropharchaeia archaeon]